MVIICDNAPCHSSAETAVNEFSNGMASVLRLGLYSPMLNPIEAIWSKIKSCVKSSMDVPDVQGPGLAEQRLQYLERKIDDAKVAVTGGHCARATQHCFSFHADVLALRDMPAGE